MDLNFGNLAAFRTILAIFSLGMGRNGYEIPVKILTLAFDSLIPISL